MPHRKEYFIDWTTLPDIALEFILQEIAYPSYEADNPKDVPMVFVIRRIMEEFNCVYRTAWVKLRLLVKENPELKLIRKSNKRKSSFDKVRYARLIRYSGKKRYVWKP